MALKKCTAGVALSKGMQSVESVRLTVQEKQYFTPVLTCSNLVKAFHTCSHLYTPVHTCSHLLTPVHTSSHLLTPFHTCSQLFTPVHTCSHLSDLSTLFVQRKFLVDFSPRDSCYFSILRAFLLRLHISAHLINSYPTVYDLSSCIQIKISIPQAAHTKVTMYACRAMSFFALTNALIFQYFVPSC